MEGLSPQSDLSNLNEEQLKVPIKNKEAEPGWKTLVYSEADASSVDGTCEKSLMDNKDSMLSGLNFARDEFLFRSPQSTGSDNSLARSGPILREPYLDQFTPFYSDDSFVNLSNITSESLINETSKSLMDNKSSSEDSLIANNSDIMSISSGPEFRRYSDLSSGLSEDSLLLDLNLPKNDLFLSTSDSDSVPTESQLVEKTADDSLRSDSVVNGCSLDQFSTYLSDDSIVALSNATEEKVVNKTSNSQSLSDSENDCSKSILYGDEDLKDSMASRTVVSDGFSSDYMPESKQVGEATVEHDHIESNSNSEKAAHTELQVIYEDETAAPINEDWTRLGKRYAEFSSDSSDDSRSSNEKAEAERQQLRNLGWSARKVISGRSRLTRSKRMRIQRSQEASTASDEIYEDNRI